MLNENSRRLKEITRSMGIGKFVEVKFDGSTNVKTAELKIEDVKLKDSSSLQCDFQVRDEADNFSYRIEVRLCGRRFPVARCNCDKGLQTISCEHLVKGVQMYEILNKLGIVESLIPARPFVWIPYSWQAN